MIRLTEAQLETLQRMPRYHVVAQFISGAVVVAFDQMYHNASVVDTDGQVYAFSRYLAMVDQRF